MEKVYRVDETDLKILKILEEDSKTNYREIADKVEIAIGTVSNRINNLKDAGIIRKFTIDMDVRRIGYEITSLVLMQIEGGFIEEVEKELEVKTNVYAIYDTTGDWDSIIAVKFKQMDELNAFIKELNKNPHVKRTSTCVCLNVIKENIFFPIQLPEEEE